MKYSSLLIKPQKFNGSGKLWFGKFINWSNKVKHEIFEMKFLSCNYNITKYFCEKL